MMPHTAMMVILGVAFMAALIVSLVLHELGHLWAARLLRIRVATVHFGIGPELFGWTTRSNVRWRVSALPVCGYVSLLVDRTVWPGRWRMARVVAVFAAGPAINLLFATILFFIVLATAGQRFNPPDITSVAAGYPADFAGIQPGDRILSIGGVPVDSMDEISGIIMAQPQGPMPFRLLNAGQERTVTLTPLYLRRPARLGPEIYTMRLGAYHGGPPQYRKVTRSEALGQAVIQTWTICLEPFLDTAAILKNGPPREPKIVGEVPYIRYKPVPARAPGVADLLFLAAIVSANLGLINLCPLPLLDGGQILYYGVATLVGRMPGRTLRRVIYRSISGFVMLLIVLATRDHLVRIGSLP